MYCTQTVKKLPCLRLEQGFLGSRKPKFRLKENLSEKYLNKLEALCPGLKVLNLQDCFIHGFKVKFSHLPKSLEKLSLAGQWNYRIYYLHKISTGTSPRTKSQDSHKKFFSL